MHLLDLDSSAPRQFLDWLVELGIRLNVIIDVIDVMTLPCLPSARRVTPSPFGR